MMRYAYAAMLVAALAGSAGTATAQTQPADRPAPLPEKKTCRALTPTGSFMPTRVCDTKAGWAAFDGHNRQGAAQFRDALRMTGTNERQGQ